MAFFTDEYGDYFSPEETINIRNQLVKNIFNAIIEMQTNLYSVEEAITIIMDQMCCGYVIVQDEMGTPIFRHKIPFVKMSTIKKVCDEAVTFSYLDAAKGKYNIFIRFVIQPAKKWWLMKLKLTIDNYEGDHDKLMSKLNKMESKINLLYETKEPIDAGKEGRKGDNNK